MAFAIRNSLASASQGGAVKPGAPSNINVVWNAVAAATSTATVTFNAGSPPGLSYTVSATPSGGSATTPITALPGGTTVSSLANNTNHTFTVVAIRGALTASATSGSTLSPVGPVTIGTISSITNSGASVAYTAPTGGGTYAITTTPATNTTASSSNPQAVSGLTGNTNYTFTVKVSNATGNNSSTSGSYLTIPDKPTIGTVSVTNATTVSVPYTLATGNTGAGTGTITSVTIVSSPSISLSYTITSASPVSVTGSFVSGTTYTFTISVTNSTGTSAVSNASGNVVFTPAVPGKPTATASGTTITVTWTTVTGATAYNVVCSTGGLTAQNDVNGTSTTFTGTVGTTYAFTVAAKNAGGTSSASTASDNVVLIPEVPGKPTASLSGTTITVSWSAVTGATAYNVVCSTGGLTAQNDVNGTSTTFTGTAGSTYAFTVAAKNTGGTSSASTASDNVVLIPAVPGKPSASASGTTITVSWTAVNGAATYNVVCSTGGLTANNDVTGTSTTFTGADGTTYAFTVAAKNSGGTSSASTASDNVVLTPAVPGKPTASLSGTTITVSWSAVTGATAYNVVCSTGGLTSNNDVTGTSTTFTGTAGTTYAFTVAAKNSGGTSSASTASDNVVMPSALLYYYRFMSNDAYSTSYLYNWASGSASATGAGISDSGINPVQTTNYININSNTGASTNNSSVIFGGSNSATIASTSFSIAFWFNSVGLANTWLVNLQAKDSGNNDVNVSLIQSYSSGTKSKFYDRWVSSAQYTSDYDFNTWHHYVIVVKSGQAVCYYFDNVKKTSGTTYTWTGSITTNRFALGYGACCEGFFADVRFYTSALLDADVNTLYTTSYSVTSTVRTDVSTTGEGGQCVLSNVLYVIAALYTANGSSTGGLDVRSKVQGYLSGGNLNFGANNTNFGDPLPGTYKWLYLTYIHT